MSTLDMTVNMMQECTEDELLALQGIVRQFLIAHDKPSLTQEQFMEELELSGKQYEAGMYDEAVNVSARLRDKYGI